jgi:tRNA nucleotidyltransferase (CCA-adding enzyme)
MRRNPSRDLSRLLLRLRRRGEVRSLARVIRELGREAWLVGGAVRDAGLGLRIADSEVDVAVSGDAEGIARALESAGMGRAVFLSRDRPGPRVFRVAGRRPLDIAEIEGGSIEKDLERRDFTVNALAVSLADGSLLDPFGGMADLGRGRLRPVRASNLLDDPLRALRAARLYATLGLVPDRQTLDAARAAAPRLAGVAAERIGTELSLILGSPRAAEPLRWAAAAGILGATLGVSLDPGEAARLAASLRPLDDRATARLPEGARRRIRLAALALPLRPDAAGARKWLLERRLPRREVEDAARLAELVRRPPPAWPERRLSRHAWGWIVEAGPLAAEALHLLERSGRRSERRSRTVARLRRLAGRKRRRVAVGGGDVMEWLGIPAGPQIGRLLSELAVEIASGQVKSRREARNWLTGQVHKRASAL